jgi:hypothetical protein
MLLASITQYWFFCFVSSFSRAGLEPALLRANPHILHQPHQKQRAGTVACPYDGNLPPCVGNRQCLFGAIVEGEAWFRLLANYLDLAE